MDWIKTEQRPPTKDDADISGYVMVCTARGTIGFEEWQDVGGWSGTYPYWRMTPLPPDGCLELRRQPMP